MRRYHVEKGADAPEPPTDSNTEKPKRYKVEKGIPIPPRGNKEDKRFPWADMAPGEAFFVPLEDEPDRPSIERLHKRMSTRCQNASRRWGPTNGAHYIARKGEKAMPDGRKVAGVWVWRDDKVPKTTGEPGAGLRRAARSG